MLDTHQLSPIAPQWRDAALSADTQFVPWTGLQQNAFPHATAPTPLSWKGPASSWEDPLQWVTNQNLCQAMRQLVSLLKQADSVFGDLEVRGEGCVLTVLG